MLRMTSTDPNSHEPLEFIFGTLSTRAGRAQRARALHVGLQPADFLNPIDPRPAEPITVSVRAGLGITLQAATLHYTLDGAPPELDAPATMHVAMQRDSSQWDTLAWTYVETWSAIIPGQPAGTRVRYKITAIDDAGAAVACPHINLTAPDLRQQPEAFDQRYLHRLLRDPSPQVYEFNVDDTAIPHWLHAAIIYQIFVDRFAPDPDQSFADGADLSSFLGGTLRGIIDRLDYVSELGVTCLWLTPIFPAPSHHGYDPTDYFSIEPRLGSEADFRALSDAAHQRGLRLVLDFVANHVSRRHPAFAAAQQDPVSPYRDWFFFRQYPDEYEAFYDVPDQPIVNTDHPAVRSYLIGAARHWLSLGCDGFRLDHAHGATHAFWSAFRAATRSEKSDAATFGEITETPAVMRSFAGRMDGVLDFHVLELLRGFFAFQSITASQLDQALRQHYAYFGSELVLPTFLDNHDMNRFLWNAGGDTRRLKLAALCQFTLPQPPIVYYGTEVGVTQRQAVGRLEEARLPMPWGDQQDRALLAFYRDLIALRRQTTEVWSLPRETVHVDDVHGLYAYRCGAYTVYLNNSAAPVTAVCQPGELVLTTDAAAALRSGELRLPPFAGAVRRSR
jgi:cyclomaltodextrinase / maltogenic alpha-amylase / neopullulanase